MAGPIFEHIATRGRVLYGAGLVGWLPNPDPILRKTGRRIDVYRDLRADAHVSGCIKRRKASVIAMERGLDRGNASSAIYKSVSRILGRLGLISANAGIRKTAESSRTISAYGVSILSELLDGALYGYQPAEIMWEKMDGQIEPSQVVGKPPEWFVFDYENIPKITTIRNQLGENLPDRKFLFARNEPSYDNPYGIAELGPCYWPTTFKRGVLKFWVEYSEKFGSPFMLGKLPRNASEHEYIDLADKLESMVRTAVATIPDDSSVEMLSASGGTGATTFEQLLMFCRSEISIALLGQNQTTEATSNRASSASGLEVAREIRDGDARMLESEINRLIGWIVDINWPGSAAPTWSMWEQEEVDLVIAGRDVQLTNAGVRFTRGYFQRQYDLRPDDIEATSSPQPAVSAPASAQFSEFDPSIFPDQAALDSAIGNLIDDGSLSDQARKLIEPVLKAISGATDPAKMLGALATAYPDMQPGELVDTIERLLFAADLIGRMSAKQEME